MEYTRLGSTGLQVSHLCLIGATKISHLQEAVSALPIRLPEEDVAYLEEPYIPHEIVGHS